VQFPHDHPRELWLPASRWPLLALTALLTACGGGGGGGGDEDEFFNVLAFYDYAISNPAGGPVPVTKTVRAPGQPDDTYSINAGTGTIRGRYTTSTENLTIAATTTYTVNWSAGGPAPASFAVAFTGQGDLPSNLDRLTNGSFAVTWGADTITVDHNQADVQVALNGGAPVTFPFTNYAVLDLPGVVAEDWQRVAARASRALTETLLQAKTVPSFLERVNDGELDSGQAVTVCESIPGTPPAGVMQTGENRAQELGGGTQYRTTFDDCFFPSPFVNDVGVIANGTIDRVNLVTDPTSGGEGSSLLEFGFVAPGGVTYDTLSQFATESAPGVWTLDGTEIEVTGGWSILFTYPP
jgi:hypothetical protein